MKKYGKLWGLCVVSFLMALFLSCITVSAGVQEGENQYEIYPTPQEITYGTGTVQITDQVNLETGEKIDDYTKARITEALAVLNVTGSETASTSKLTLKVGVYNSGDGADVYGKSNGADDTFFAKNDAYMLFIKENSIVVLGKNTDAAFYGVTTLKHIFKQLTGKSVRELTIKDYSEVASRGFIEGYYGNPWSTEDRIDLMKFGGEIKMNQYIFAPKDDPYHNAQWREKYPEEEGNRERLDDLKKVAQAGNESKCFFVYTLHPFMNNPIDFGTGYEADLKCITDKFEQLLGIGVRQFGILEDDSSGTTAENIIKLLTDLGNWIQEKQKTYSDLRSDILYCPTSYMGTGDDKLQTISAGVGSNVHIMMTGGKIWGEVTDSFATSFHTNVNRYPYMWVNWPCNDNSKKNLVMGGQNKILQAGLDGTKYEGVVLNPMQFSEPSKVGIFTAADFCWNVWEEAAEGDQAWEDSFKYIDHLSAVDSEEADALREMGKHMINQGPIQTSGRQVPFEESVELSPKLDAFYEKLMDGSLAKSDVTDMRAEFKKLNDAAKLYLDQGKNKRLIDQIPMFLNCMRDLSQANIYMINAIEAALDGDNNAIWENFSNAQTAYEASQSYGFWYVNHTEYAEVGNQYIVPFTDNINKYLSDLVQQILDPEHIRLEETFIIRIGGKTSTKGYDVANATDGSLSTNVQFQINQIEDDYVGISFNKLVPVSNINLALAVSGHENDYIPNGVMEYTLDGKTWTAFSKQPESSAADVYLEFEPMAIKGFRWRADSIDKNRWLIIREIGYNVNNDIPVEDEGKYTISDVTHTEAWVVQSANPQSNLTDGDESSYVWYDSGQGSGGDSSLAGDYLQVDLGSVKSVGRVRVIVGADSGDKWVNYHLEYSTTGMDESWTALDSFTGGQSGQDIYDVNLDNVSARYIRLVNDQQVDKWIKFSEFSVYSKQTAEKPAGQEMDYTNTVDAGWRVEYGEELSRVIPQKSVSLKPGEYIGFALDRIHEITEITVTGSNTNKLSLSQSINQTKWIRPQQGAAARYIRLTNTSDAVVTFDLDSFVVKSKEIGKIAYLESTIADSGNAEDPRNAGTTGYWFDGDLTTGAKYCVTPQQGQHITYDLRQTLNLNAVKVYVLDTEVDYPRDAEIRVSTDGERWETILTIGDGQQNGGSDKDTKPAENGWKHDTVDPAYSYMENTGFNVSARYIQLYFTAAYSERYIKLNEILLNNGEYFKTVNDPTFETDPIEEKGYAPQNLNDLDLTTAFKPNMKGKTAGSLIYKLSESTKVIQLNILQSGSNISHASVSVRASEDGTWEQIGSLEKSFNTFYTAAYDDIYEVKLEWENVTPVIYEIIALSQTSTLEKSIENIADDVKQAESVLGAAKDTLSEAQKNVDDATNKVKQAKTTLEKLQAEMELANANAAKAAAEAVVAEHEAALAEIQATAAQMQGRLLTRQAEQATSDADRSQLEAQAQAKMEEAGQKLQEAENKRTEATDKQKDQNSYLNEAANKKNEIANLQKNPNKPNPPKETVTTATVKSVNYRILNAAQKTAVAYGTSNKNAKSLTIAKTVTIDGVTYSVTQIGVKAFKNCKKLTKVTVGANVQSIGKEAFAGCKKLKSVNMKKASKIKKFGKKAFSKISAKAKIKVPAKQLKVYKKKLKKTGLPKKAKISK